MSERRTAVRETTLEPAIATRARSDTEPSGARGQPSSNAGPGLKSDTCLDKGHAGTTHNALTATRQLVVSSLGTMYA